MVFGRYFTKIVKKKHSATSQDKKDWLTFTKHMGEVHSKDSDFLEKKNNVNKIQRLDLHGFTLDNANKSVKKFIINSFNNGFKKVLIITGKGLRSKSQDNPYISKKYSTLKNSVPEYLNNEEDLRNKINKISYAALGDGGEGAIYVFLKKKKIKG